MTVTSFALRAVGVLLIALPPVLGAWLASSLTAYLGGPVHLAAAAAFIAVIGLPVVWELDANRRRAKKAARLKALPKPRELSPRSLTTTQRLVVRTVVVNLALCGVLVGLFPKQAFPAVAIRGDWMLDGRDGDVVDLARTGLHDAAEGLAFLYKLSVEDPYKNVHPVEEPPPDPSKVVPPPPPTPLPPEPVQVAEPSVDALAWPIVAELHPAVKAITPEDEKSPATVALFLRGHSKKGADRVRALHDYVADRIAYDTDAYHARNFPPHSQDADVVFRTHKGVCAGYAALLKKLGDLAGENIVYLRGDGAGGGTVEGHAWNAAMVDGKWRLIDVTWDAGYSNGDNDGFHKKFDTGYLFAPPDFFVATHMPDDAKWQLLDHPIDRGEFLRKPKLNADFYRAGLELVSPTSTQVDAVGGAIDVEVKNTKHTRISAQACHGGVCERCDEAPLGATRVRCALKPGANDVRFFAALKPDDRSWPEVATFDVNSR